MLSPRAQSRKLLFLLLLFGAVLRIRGLFSSLEYDEIWTLTFFAGKDISVILTDLVTPNNHPLNTICVKISALLFPNMPALIRIIPLLAGIASIACIGDLAANVFRSRRAAWFSAAAAATSQPLILYSASARGYSLQVFLILLFTDLLFHAEKKRILLIPAVLSGILAVVTVTTSVLFLFPVSLLFWTGRVLPEKKKIPAFTAGFAVLGLFILAWCIGNYEGLTAGQARFGTVIASAGDLFRFIGSTLTALGGPLILILSALGILLCLAGKKRRKTAGALLFCTFFPLAAALASRSGPPRVYLPLLPVMILSAGYASARISVLLKRKRVLIVAETVLLACGVFFSPADPCWNRTDWFRTMPELSALSPEFSFSVLPTESLPVIWNLPGTAESWKIRLRSMAPGSSLLQIGSDKLTALGSNGSGTEFLKTGTTVRIGGMECGKFRVRDYAAENLSAGGVILVSFLSVPAEWKNQLPRLIASFPGIRRAGILNFWISVRGTDPAGMIDFVMLAEPDRKSFDPESFRQMMGRVRASTGLFTVFPEN